MELPHWLMAGGALLLVVGFIGSVLQKNVQPTSDQDGREDNQSAEAQTPVNPTSEAAA
jgi:hypothetical protein